LLKSNKHWFMLMTLVACLIDYSPSIAQNVTNSVDDAAINQESSSSQDQNTTNKALLSFPKWSDFPAAPVNIPSSGSIKIAVEKTLMARSEVESELLVLNWDAGTPEALGFDISQRIQPKNYKGLDPMLESNELEVYAENLRRRGAPPKPYD
jgi:hypothetical protein